MGGDNGKSVLYCLLCLCVRKWCVCVCVCMHTCVSVCIRVCHCVYVKIR